MYPIYSYLGYINECKDIPITFPAQHQEEQPGLEYLMVPQPICENPEYIGSCKLKDKVVIITGGDSGIGRAIAYLFAKEGAKVVIVYLDEEKDAIETKQHIEKMGGECIAIAADLRLPENCKKVVKITLDTYSKINILINNIAVQFVQDSILDITPEQLLLTYETNVFSYFYMIQEVLPYLHENDSIINTASITAYKGQKQLIDYSSTKGAIVSLTRSLSESLISKGIRVNAVAPGPVWTPLIPASFSAAEVSTFGAGTSKVPMMRAGQPFEIATSYLFLASDDSKYMSGQVLHPNGGEIVGS